MKIVFDTNVLLAGLFARGVCEAVLDASLGNEVHHAFLSEFILREFAGHATGKFRVPEEIARRAVTILRDHATLVVPLAMN